ncbi:MAG: family 10 glycosylhydrolase [candidate division WOR-3 bacterium]|nr:family 10 glycosylhydrolase [candidate division WOR-3 bacterium]
MIEKIKSPFKRAFVFLLIPVSLFAYQIKGIWITRWELNSPDNIKSLADSLYRAGITDAYVQVFGSGEAYYESSTVPVKYNSFDPLGEFIKYSDKRYRVHAWINLLYMWDRRELTEDSNHILQRHPEAVLRDHTMRSIMNYTHDDLRKRNIEGIYVSPASEDVRKLIISVISEIMTQYDIDGIHLDYCRYPGKEFVYDPYLRSRFQSVYLVDPALISSTDRRIYGNNVSAVNWAWEQFPAQVLTGLIADINTMVHEYSSEMTLSASVIADIVRAGNSLHQSWWEWIDNDYIDYAVIMAYSPYLTVIKKQIENIRNRVGLERIVVGLGSYNQSLKNVKYNYEMLSIYNPLGVSIFSSKSLMDKEGGFSYVGDYIFSKNAQ